MGKIIDLVFDADTPRTVTTSEGGIPPINSNTDVVNVRIVGVSMRQLGKAASLDMGERIDAPYKRWFAFNVGTPAEIAQGAYNAFFVCGQEPKPGTAERRVDPGQLPTVVVNMHDPSQPPKSGASANDSRNMIFVWRGFS
jgi:hypothetical protein